MSYDDVCAVMREIKPTSSEDLMKAFKKMDINGDGYITQDELAKVLTQVGRVMFVCLFAWTCVCVIYILQNSMFC